MTPEAKFRAKKIRNFLPLHVIYFGDRGRDLNTSFSLAIYSNYSNLYKNEACRLLEIRDQKSNFSIFKPVSIFLSNYDLFLQ